MSEANKKKTEENCKKYAKHFKASEFKCECDGKYCDGYPAVIDPNLLINLEKVRSHYGDKPIQITSGLRCQKYNDSLKGSSKTSKHLQGLAADFNIKPITWDGDRRSDVMAYIRKLPNYGYTYGNTPNMGVAIHMDVKKTAKPLPKPVSRNTKVDQLEVKSKTINCRTDAGLKAEVIGLIPVGYYNSLGEKSADGYTWVQVEQDRWCALIKDKTILLQKEPEKDYEKMYNQAHEENLKLLKENAVLKDNAEKAIKNLKGE